MKSGLRDIRLSGKIPSERVSSSTHDLTQQPLRLLLERADVSPDFVRGAQGLGLVEVAGEADLVASLDAGWIDDVS